MPNTITEIGDSTFDGCRSLTDITIPDSVTKIKNWAFSYCSRLTDITIPNSVTEIGNSAFSYCSRLTAFYGKYASNDNRCLIKDGILLAFAPCDITKYTILNSVTEIGNSAFAGCRSLTDITIPDSVTKIGYSAFYGCSSLTSITIPDSVTMITSQAFYNCLSLTSVYCKATTPPNRHLLDIFGKTFKNNSSDRKIYVPKSEDSTILEEYKLAHIWKEYKDDIYEYDFDKE